MGHLSQFVRLYWRYMLLLRYFRAMLNTKGGGGRGWHHELKGKGGTTKCGGRRSFANFYLEIFTSRGVFLSRKTLLNVIKKKRKKKKRRRKRRSERERERERQNDITWKRASKIVREERRARQTNGQKWTKEKGTNGLVRRVRATAVRRTKGTRVKVVTGDRDEASSKVMLRLRKPAVRDVISVLLYPIVCSFSPVFLSLFRPN